MQEEWGADGKLEETDDLVTCVARFGRDAAREERDYNPHVTGARMAQTNGHELLLSYSGDAVYRYSIYDSPSDPKRSSIIPSNVTNSTGSSSASSKSPTPGTASALENALAEGMVESDDEGDSVDSASGSGSGSDSDADEMSEGEDESEPAQLDRPIIRPVKDYRGTANVRTVKDVNFLGPNDEFVTSGSDDGNWFLWSKKSGEVLGIWEGDGTVVNMVEGHPFLPVVAVSGIDDTVKIFEPSPGAKHSNRMSIAPRIMQENESANSEDIGYSHSVLTALQILHASGRIPEIEGEPECQTQ